MVIAILLAVVGFHHLFEGIDRGRIFGYLASVVQIALAGYFALDWYRYSCGYYAMSFNSNAYEIRERESVITTGMFSDLKEKLPKMDVDTPLSAVTEANTGCSARLWMLNCRLLSIHFNKYLNRTRMTMLNHLPD